MFSIFLFCFSKFLPKFCVVLDNHAGQPDKEILIRAICYNIELVARVTGKRRQAHTGPNRNTRSVTGVFNTAPFLAGPPHHVLDLGDFMGCGGT